jgi:hypothetical protein
MCGYEVVRLNNGVSWLQVFKDHDDSDIQIIQMRRIATDFSQKALNQGSFIRIKEM